jgi:hypothetical protein
MALTRATGKQITLKSEGTGSVVRNLQDKINETVSVKDFGAVGDGVTDDTAAIQAAADAAHTNDVINFTLYFPAGTYRTTDTIDLRRVRLEATGANIQGDHSNIVVILGGRAQNGNNPKQMMGTVTRLQGTDSQTTPTVRIIGAKVQYIEIQSANYIQLYADSDNSNMDGSIAYSRFAFKTCGTLELWTNPNYTGSPTQWINENYFELTRIYNLYIRGTYGHNKNIFLGGVFEGTIDIDFAVGTCNQLLDARFESISGNIVFGSGTSGNVVRYSWFSSNIGDRTESGHVTDNGTFNRVYSYFEEATPYQPITGFSFESLKQNAGGDYNIAGVTNLNINATNISSTGSWRNVFVTPKIPVVPKQHKFLAYAYNLTSGGVRVKIDGYDSAHNLITPTGSDVTIPGGSTSSFGVSHVSSNTNPGILNGMWVLNPNCAYITITFYVPGAGLTCDGLIVSARINDNQGDRFATVPAIFARPTNWI